MIAVADLDHDLVYRETARTLSFSMYTGSSSHLMKRMSFDSGAPLESLRDYADRELRAGWRAGWPPGQIEPVHGLT